MTIETHLAKIALELHQAEAYLAAIQAKMTELEQAGIYPAVPTERWKNDRYLYLYFAEGFSMPHLFNGLKLDSKSRLYIGADPARIEDARRMVENRRHWETLSSRARELESWINRIKRDLKELAGQAERWQRENDGKLLGLEIAGQPGAASPNGLGPENAGSSGANSPKEQLGTDIRVDQLRSVPNGLGPASGQVLVASSPK